MELGLLAGADLKKLFGLLGKAYKVFAPVERKAGVAFEAVGDGGEAALGFSNTRLSPKSLFLPRCEVLCTFEGGALRDAPPLGEKRAVLGMRPCDALALEHLDRVFDKEDFKDPYYIERRRNTTVVTLACAEPLGSCFCTSFGGGPAVAEGSDAMVFTLGGRLLFEALTEKGRVLIAAAASLFTKPSPDDLKAKDKLKTEAEKRVPRVKGEGVKEKLEKGFESPLWSGIAERCLGCGVCTYLCPTCHCFDVTDETAGGKGRRIRTWDSCQHPLFTLHASGHNPRPSKTERMRQRVMHKFYYAAANFGRTFCVGCGRCVRNCPVNLDIREAVELIAGGKAGVG